MNSSENNIDAIIKDKVEELMTSEDRQNRYNYDIPKTNVENTPKNLENDRLYVDHKWKQSCFSPPKKLLIFLYILIVNVFFKQVLKIKEKSSISLLIEF